MCWIVTSQLTHYLFQEVQSFLRAPVGLIPAWGVANSFSETIARLFKSFVYWRCLGCRGFLNSLFMRGTQRNLSVKHQFGCKVAYKVRNCFSQRCSRLFNFFGNRSFPEFWELMCSLLSCPIIFERFLWSLKYSSDVIIKLLFMFSFRACPSGYWCRINSLESKLHEWFYLRWNAGGRFRSLSSWVLV